MEKKITSLELEHLSNAFGVDKINIKTVLLVESPGVGFSSKTGKILIQFEPSYFEHYTRTKILNGVEGQEKEWQAYYEACNKDQHCAMLSTSWGMSQIMGANHKLAGYATVEAMVKDFEISEFYHVRAMIEFIKSNPAAWHAFKTGNWTPFAEFYNGKKFRELAAKLGTVPYDDKLRQTNLKLRSYGLN
jgi:hypothetical protein